MKRVHLLGIPIDAVTAQQALDHLHTFLEQPAQRHVMTPNSEMLVASKKNEAFKSVLRSSALNLPDSIGLIWMANLTHQHLPERVTGVDTVQALCRTLDERHPVFLLGAGEGIAEQAAEVLRSKNSRLKIVGVYAGSPSDRDAPDIIRRINEAEPHVLFVAYGAPKQDLWISQHLKEIPSVRIAMGVGGTFDFLAGVQKRAPVVFRKLGLEWLWRLFKEPRRFKRILNAVVVFPLLVLRYGKNYS